MSQLPNEPKAPENLKFPAKLLWIAAAIAVVLVSVALILAIALPSTVVSGFAVSVSALATLTLAALTAVLLWANWQVVQATNKMADATADEAAATREEAAATKKSAQAIEAQVEAASRPVLVVLGSGGDEVTVRNVGPGPALNCIYFAMVEGEQEWTESVVMHIGSGRDGTAQTGRSHLAVTPSSFGDAPGRFKEVVFCEDVIGRAFRFRIPYPVPDVWTPGEREEDWAHVYRSQAHRKR